MIPSIFPSKGELIFIITLLVIGFLTVVTGLGFGVWWLWSSFDIVSQP